MATTNCQSAMEILSQNRMLIEYNTIGDVGDGVSECAVTDNECAQLLGGWEEAGASMFGGHAK